MNDRVQGGGKLPGKAEYSGRRRIVTRKSGYKVHPSTSGGDFRKEEVPCGQVAPGDVLTIEIQIPEVTAGEWVGYGGWFWYRGRVQVSVTGGPKERTLTEHGPGAWNKIGSLWRPATRAPCSVEITFRAVSDLELAIFAMDAGPVTHHYLKETRQKLLANMYSFAPEANFYDEGRGANVVKDAARTMSASVDIVLKSCNRCGRYLPINIPPNERAHLSFSNHCVAAHRRPCAHGAFGKLRDVRGSVLQLDFGFQLECRFCKKFEVNAAHNPKRSAAQMKEDGARRRALELLIEALYLSTPQLLYRSKTGGRELTDDVWEKFGGHCFKCGARLKSKNTMHLDHTRPLKLLWPLDGTATALCGSCNSEKRDRPPVEYYTDEQLIELSKISGCPIVELRSPAPNIEARNLSTTLRHERNEFTLQPAPSSVAWAGLSRQRPVPVAARACR